MKISKKAWIVIIIVAVVAVALFYFSKKAKDKKAVSGSTNPYEDLIQARIAKIKANSEWMAAIPAKAEERGITIEQMIRRDAIWWLKTKELTIPQDYTE